MQTPWGVNQTDKNAIIDSGDEEPDKEEHFVVTRVKLIANREVWPKMKSWNLTSFISFRLVPFCLPSVKANSHSSNNYTPIFVRYAASMQSERGTK